MSSGWYRTIRLALWFVAFLVAASPAFLELMTSDSITNTLLRDFVFVIIPAAALGLSTVLDYLCMNFRVVSGTALALSILAIIFNMLALSSGLVGFLVVPKNDLLATNRELWPFGILVVAALLMSLVTEFFVSTDNHRCHAARGQPVTGT